VQVGEPVSAAPPGPSADNVEFDAELVSVTFKGSLKTSHGRATISGPHWEAGKDSQLTDDWKDMARKLGLSPEPYSRRAAVYLIKGAAGASHDVQVKVKVNKSRNVSGEARLIGNLKGLTVEGKCPTSVGEHVVAATFTDVPEDIQQYRGRMAWALEVPSAASVNLGTSLAEVYFIVGPPTKPYAKVGVWSEVLRFLCGKVGVLGLKEADAINDRVTRYCHGEHRLRYDTDHGAAHYGTYPGGGVFRLGDYMRRTRSVCNCYDQASAVQVLVGALGIRVAWLYLDPFGYIKPTNLVGVGLCNNPFFGRDERKRVVPWNSPERTAFGNHAFIGTTRSLATKIFDACGGPHTGTERAAEYVDSSIDRTAALYGSQYSPGTAADIVVQSDVANVD
jgi:hypothetical protein